MRVVYLTDRALEIVKRLMLVYPEGPLFRNSDGEPWTEVVIATNPTLEGEATAMYIAERVAGQRGEADRHGYRAGAAEHRHGEGGEGDIGLRLGGGAFPLVGRGEPG